MDRKKILLVEDERILALAQAKKVSRRGYDVETVHTGEAAVERVKKGREIDLVLMDIDLGSGIDGTEAATRILAIRFIPIVFLTSHSEEEVVEKVKRITRYGYVIKNSGDFVLFSSIKMAFDLYDAHVRALRNEEKYLKIFENANDAIFLHKIAADDTPGFFLEVNNIACRQLGYTREELLLLRPSDIDAPASSELIPGIMESILEEGKVRFDALHLSKSGEIIPVEINAHLFELDGEKVILSVVRDMRKRKKWEEQLKFQAMVLDQIQDRVTVTDMDGIITYVNDADSRMFGVSKEELIGKHISVYGDDAARGGTQEEIVREAREKGFWRGEVVNFTSQGEEHILDARVQVLINKDGEKVGLCGISTDITEWKRLEENLRYREENLDVTLRSIGDAVIVTDIQGKVLRTNPKAEELTGWSSEDALGRDLEEIFVIVNNQTDKKAENPFYKVISTGQVVGLANHTLLIAKDGRRRQISDSAAPIHGRDGSLLGVVLVFRDVTKEYQLQEEIRKSKVRLETAQRVASIGSWELNLNDRTVIASKEAFRIYGIPEGPLTIEEIQAIPLPEYRHMMDDALKDLISGKRPYDLEFQIRRKSDQAVLDIHSVAEYDRDKNLVIGTLQDVTRRKNAESRNSASL